MTFSKQVLFLTFSMTFLLFACGEKDASVREAARESLPQRAPQDMLQQAAAATPTATGSVYHYTCPNGCEGGGGDSQGACAVCNAALVHNQAYHNQPAEPANDPFNIQEAPTTSGQSTAGVFHYICPDGDPGGAADAGACATCGKALVHNQAYHNSPASAGNTGDNPIDMQQLMQQQQQSATPQPTNSAQNAAGVFHYTCANGCVGGAGSAVACASCGSTLVHNQAYHN